MTSSHDAGGDSAAQRARIALVFDDRTRPETTGVYCRRALEELAEVTFFQPSRLAEVPRSGFDLYLNIDDGMRYLWRADLHPSAWWAIDTHIEFEWSLEKAKGFDLVFAAQRDGAALLRREGIASARWLPLACDPPIHGNVGLATPTGAGDAQPRAAVPHGGFARLPVLNSESDMKTPEARQFDICFVGNLIPGERTDLVRLIQQHFKSVYVGQAYFEEMAAIYTASRIVFNRSVANDVNMRVFEALASGSLLLTNDLAENGQAELFRDGVHLATYDDGRDLLDKLRYYLRRDDVREKIAAAGREEVLAKHTYAHRMAEILAAAKARGQGSGVRIQGNTSAERGVRNAEYPQRVSQEECRVAGETTAEGGCATSERDGLGSPSSGAAERHRGRSLQIRRGAKAHDAAYFDFARPEVLECVPIAARRVLEIGCGTGRLGEALKKRQACEVVGVEIDLVAAQKATERLDRVYVGNVEQLELNFADRRFDCLVCADVLEHLFDPGGFLRRARRWLQDDATVVASIPNVRHHSVVGSLIEGNWTYEPAGLLDNTHLHFYTLRDAEALFAESGYEVEQVQFVPGPGYDEWQKQEDRSQVQLAGVRLTGMPLEETVEFFAYQFLISAKPALAARENKGRIKATARDVLASPQASPRRGDSGTAAAAKLVAASTKLPPDLLPNCVSLMVTYNRLEYTRLAVEALLQLDYPTLRIVVWDNASSDGTVEFLRERLAVVPQASVIASPVNRGVVFPMNEVWSSHPEAELLAKIDNDTLVPPDLLRRLADCHLKSATFGVLSGFHFRQEGEALAEEHRIKTFDGVRVLPQPYVGGCAVMIRRDVFKKLGLISCRSDGPQQRPFMDSGWTVYQQRLTEEGLVNGYPWPPIHVDHMEDTRSARCIRSEEHQRYKRDERGMDLEEFTNELCVWRPNWTEEPNRDGQRLPHRQTSQAVLLSPRPVVHPSLGQNDGDRSYARMRFRQDFTNDLDQFDFWGRPFAFARFADGERAICTGRPIEGQDGWSFDGRQAGFAEQLNAALRYDAPGYYIGISDGCCDRPAKEWYLAQINLPLERVTFSNIFVNANYRRFQKLDTRDMATVASEGGDYWLPADVMNGSFDLDRLVERLLAVDRPILISAGPASCIIIHKYWQRAVKKQVIVDVGSAIDERTKGRRTRNYQTPGTRTAEMCCVW